MRALHRYFTNPFDARGISLDELMAFATDCYQRMRANNPGGKLDDRIAATETAIADLRAATSSDLGGHGTRKGSKWRKRQFRRALPAEIARVFGFMIAHFGPRSPQVRQCGRRETFRRCTDDTLKGHLRALRSAVAEHQARVGDLPLSIVDTLISQWAEIYQKSETATATKARTESDRRAARRRLQWELYLNLLRLVELYPRQPKKISVFMQPHLLRNQRRKKNAAATESPTPTDPETQQGQIGE